MTPAMQELLLYLGVVASVAGLACAYLRKDDQGDQGDQRADRREPVRCITRRVDECVPRRDLECLAAQLVAQCRLWVGTPNGHGLCNRRKDEARLAQS